MSSSSLEVEAEMEMEQALFTSSPVLRPHRRQFVIGSRAFQVYENWQVHPLTDSLWFSHCPELRVGWATDRDGNRWALLGLAIESRPDRLMPLLEIAQASSADVPHLYPSWAGRWVLIGQGQVHMDASGLLGCFYGSYQGQLWVSSSPVLIARLLFPNAFPITDSRLLRYEQGISWFTPPRSRFARINRLLPSQIIDLPTNRIQPRSLMPAIDGSRSYEETLELVKCSLMTTLKRLPQIHNQLWLGLTAGYDSRLMLALSRAAGIDVKPFTRIAVRMSVADRLLPPQLAQDCGYDHFFVQGRFSSLDRKPLVAAHTAGHVSDGDAEPFLKGIRDEFEGIFFGGHGFSVASGFAGLRQLPATCENPEIAAKQIAQVFQEPGNSSATAGLQEWLAWVLDHPQENLDWRDRIFIEQRQAGWLSSKEQLYDLNNLERFPILNASRTYALLLGLEEEQRLGSLVQMDLIEQIAPDLLKYPFNPDDLYFGFWQALKAKSADAPQYLLKKLKRKLRSISFAPLP